MLGKNRRTLKNEIIDAVTTIWEKNPNKNFSALFNFEKEIPNEMLLLLLKNKLERYDGE